MKMIDENDRDEWQKEMKSEPRTEEILLMSIKKKAAKLKNKKTREPVNLTREEIFCTATL
jgi:hypothetical protein